MANLYFHIPQFNYGGAEQNLIYILEYLKSTNEHDTVLITDKEKSRNLQTIESLGIAVIHFPDNKFTFLNFLKFIGPIRKLKKGVFHCQLTTSALFCLLIIIFTNHKSYLYEHSIVSQYIHNIGLKGKLTTTLRVRLIYPFLDIVACSSSVSNDLRKNYRIKSYRLIPPIIKNKALKAGKAGNYILTISRLTPEKGVLEMLELLDFDFLKEKNFSLIILGEGILKTAIMQKLKDRKLQKIIYFESDQSKLSELLTNCSLLIQPSKTESFGMVYYEGLLANKPVIALKNETSLDLETRFRGQFFIYDSNVSLNNHVQNILKENKFVFNHEAVNDILSNYSPYMVSSSIVQL